MRGEKTQTLLMLVIAFAVFSWIGFFWMTYTGLRPARKRAAEAVPATAADIAAGRRLAIVATGASVVLIWLTRKRPPVA